MLEAIPPVKNVSYLFARDPSIIAWGAAGNCRKNLLPELGEVTVASTAEQEVKKIKRPPLEILFSLAYFRVIRFQLTCA